MTTEETPRKPPAIAIGRLCFQCGTEGMCEHREPEVLASEALRMAIILERLQRAS